MKPKKKPKKSKFVRLSGRGIPEDHGPGQFNPFRSDRFDDRKHVENKKRARGKVQDED